MHLAETWREIHEEDAMKTADVMQRRLARWSLAAC